MISKVVQTELAELLSQYQDMTDAGGGPLVVRNGYLPQRELMTGMGPVDIKVPKTRDRGGQGIHFRSELLPRISNVQRAWKRYCPGFTSVDGFALGALDFRRQFIRFSFVIALEASLGHNRSPDIQLILIYFTYFCIHSPTCLLASVISSGFILVSTKALFLFAALSPFISPRWNHM